MTTFPPGQPPGQFRQREALAPHAPMYPGWYPTPDGGSSYFDGYRWAAYQPATPVSIVTHPAVGWVIAVLGGAVAVGSFMPWASALGGAITKAGTDGGGDGVFTLVIGLIMTLVGVVVGCGAGRVWASVVSALVSAGGIAIAVIDMHDVSSRSPFVSVGGGLVLVLVAGGAGFIASIVAMGVRQERR